MNVWTFTATLTLNTTIQSLPKTLKNMMAYHPVKCGCNEEQTTSIDMVETVIFDH